jgi:hypothetical protein
LNEHRDAEPAAAIDYLAPDVPGALPWHETPIVRATDESLQGLGCLVDDPRGFPIEIVRWPARGRRPVDAGTGDQGGTAVGEFEFWWEGDAMFGRNTAVNDQYLLGWSRNPADAARSGPPTVPRARLLLWHANYHPDGGQLFFPLDGQPFVTALAHPGDDVAPADFVTYYVDGGRGLYLHPNVWHEAVFPLATPSRFHDEQGKVHARVSVDFPKEFGVFLAMPLRAP